MFRRNVIEITKGSSLVKIIEKIIGGLLIKYNFIIILIIDIYVVLI